MNHIFYNHDNRRFAFCKSCYWTATFFSKIENYECPFCPGKNVEYLPLELDGKDDNDLQQDKDWYLDF